MTIALILKTLRANIVPALIAALVLALVAWGGWTLWTRATTAETKARIEAKRSDNALQSGADAANTVGTRARIDVNIDAITRQNTDAIRSIPGADAPVNADLNRAAIAGLCRYAAYRDNPDCVQRANSGRVEKAD